MFLLEMSVSVASEGVRDLGPGSLFTLTTHPFSCPCSVFDIVEQFLCPREAPSVPGLSYTLSKGGRSLVNQEPYSATLLCLVLTACRRF
ncbi:hypothetical protein E2C01_028763 [Portunus trituberculatus]|uniref:Uncharacterized protein n=1 Tax=Portunus trituberculatus TaxID=210409 RepID=A0A5B7ELI3_PORTR|nr:hypothetical protein [Portunus trituberculatus]